MENLVCTPWELCLSLDCGIHSIFNNRVGCGWQLELAIWHFITTTQNFVRGRNGFDWGFGFSNCLNFIGSFSWIKNNHAYLDLVELYNAGQKSIHYVKSFPLYPCTYFANRALHLFSFLT